MTEARRPPDVMALPVAEAVRELERAGWTVAELKAAAPPGAGKPQSADGRVARVRVVSERAVELVYVKSPTLSEE